MPSQLDIYRTANLLMVKHGDNAVIEAAMKADAMLEKVISTASGSGRRS